MKRLAALILAALMLLTVFASAASAAANETLQIRGPVYNGSNINDLTKNDGIKMDATKFAAFFYDIDNNVTTETLSIIGSNNKDRTIEKGNLVYQTTIGKTDYKYADWGNYSVLGFFAEQYIPLKSNDASKLAKLVKDDDAKITLKTGEKTDLGQGYALEAKQVDVDGKKVWLEFTKDGERVDDQIVTASSNVEESTWTCELDKIQGEDNVPVLKVHVNQVFQGAVDSIAQLDGIWLIDYANAMKIESDAEFGKLNKVSLSGPTITITNDDTMTLSRDSDVEIGQGMYFKVADSNDLRFYAYKEITEPGTYQIRGTVATGPQTWTADNFAGFFYDLKKNVATESLKVSNLKGNVIQKSGLEYSTTIKNVDYKSSNFNGSYPVLGFFAEEYVPLKANDASKLAKLVKDSDEKITLKTGEKTDLGQGYALEAKQVDVDGKKVWLEFTKDGEYVDDQIVSTDTASKDSDSKVWTCEVDKIQGEDNVPVLKVRVNQVFQGAVDSIAQIDGVWLIDYANAMKIESDAEFGKLNKVSLSGPTLNITNDDTMTLSRDSDVEIGQGMYFKVADTPVDQLRYYPYVEKTIGGGNVTTPTEEVNVTKPTENVSTTNATGNVTGNVTETTTEENVTEVTEENKTAAPTEAANKTEEKGKTPGFGVIGGIVGLVAVIYFVRRND
jgi:S-layer protein (TIGR01567 family)